MHTVIGDRYAGDHPHGAHTNHATALALAAAKTWQGRLAPWAAALDTLSNRALSAPALDPTPLSN